MNDSEKVLEVAERVMLLQSQIDTLKLWILNRPNAPSLQQLDHELFDLESRIRTAPKFRKQSDEFRRAIQSQEHAVTLLQSLHNFVLYRQEIPN
jgi:uncharacterized membrane protein YccC